MTRREPIPWFWLAMQRRLVALYPRSHRRELGGEIERLFLDLYLEARAVGRLRAAWFALRACTDLGSGAVKAHGDPESPSGAHAMRSLLLDLRYAWQVVTRQKRHTLTAMATLAIGIGATTAVFSITDAVLLRPLPFPEPERLAQIALRHPNGWGLYAHEAASFVAWSEQTQLFDFLGGYTGRTAVGRIGDAPQEIDAARLSPGLLDVIGARPLAGRPLVPEDAAEGAAPVALVSERFARDHLRGVENAVGHLLMLDDVETRVVGVLPDELAFPYARTDIWQAADPTVGTGRMLALARFAPGLDFDAAQERTDALQAGLTDNYGAEDGWELRLEALDEHRTSTHARTALLVALAAAGLLLLVAVVNVTQVALARAMDRGGELSMRAALGAGRGRIVRQVAFESLLTGIAGGLLGILLAAALVDVIAAAAPDDLIGVDAIRIGVDWRAFVAGLGLAVAAGLAAGLLPAWSATRTDLAGTLSSARPGVSTSHGRRRIQAALIVAEAGLCVVLLAGAGLLFNSFQRLTSVDPGYEIDGRMTMVVQLDREKYPTGETRMDFYERLTERVAALPGVVAAAPTTNRNPGAVGAMFVGSLESDTGEVVSTGSSLMFALAAEGYFDTVGTEIVEGRPIVASDYDTDNVVISEPLARKLFGEAPAVGRRFRTSADGDWSTVIGVAEPVASFSLRGVPSSELLYQPMQNGTLPFPTGGVVLETSLDPHTIVADLETALWDIDPDQPVNRIEIWRDTLATWVIEPRFNLLLSATFAGVALLVVLVGIAGVVGHVVASRTREFGIRMALGATGRSVLRLATLSGLRPVAIGLALGGIVVWQTTYLLSSMLFGIEPNDPATLAGVALLFLACTLIASYLPARRALRLNPVRALRTE